MSVIDEYLAKINPQQKIELERIRKIIIQTVPESEEVITYGMPGFRYKNKYLIAYAPFKNHMSIFPGSGVVQELKGKLVNFKVSKGTIQFTVESPIPEALLKEIIDLRTKEINK